ncbi:MAG: MmgE/PrpD family protein, partial [Symbiobacteriaceae bacterium]|nr:MmgE/PrpD family protein [Symbiobacteriaceae bacterium]
MTQSSLRKLVSWLKDLPSRPSERATRLCLLDALGCILYGASLEEGRKIIAAISAFGAGEVPLPGSETRLTPDSAALAMGALCHLRELDDVHVSILHPGAVIVPAAWCAAYAQDLTLAELLEAIFYGYEAAARISRGINYLQHREMGWHGTAT